MPPQLKLLKRIDAIVPKIKEIFNAGRLEESKISSACQSAANKDIVKSATELKSLLDKMLDSDMAWTARTHKAQIQVSPELQMLAGSIENPGWKTKVEARHKFPEETTPTVI